MQRIDQIITFFLNPLKIFLFKIILRKKEAVPDTSAGNR